jgi:hypothetical protein
MLRRALLGMSRSRGIKNLVTRLPVTSDVVARFVAGESAAQAIAATRQLAGAGLKITIDHLGEDTTSREQADGVALAYVDLLGRLRDAELTPAAEVSVKLSALESIIVIGPPGAGSDDSRNSRRAGPPDFDRGQGGGRHYVIKGVWWIRAMIRLLIRGFWSGSR